ncbi:hypothetical protein, partial [Serratia liquefaciens]|uniref:hypothetical protein n=1 Tax=Serratia liquefaciens TaxID=614 RepID=UPI003EC4DBE8
MPTKMAEGGSTGDFHESERSFSPTRFVLYANSEFLTRGGYFFKNGGSCRIRTCDQLIKSQLL